MLLASDELAIAVPSHTPDDIVPTLVSDDDTTDEPSVVALNIELLFIL